MRTKLQYKRDTYVFNLIKEACVFTMMAYGFQNQVMMDRLGPFMVLLATGFMFIPRVFINELCDKDGSENAREIKYPVVSEWMKNYNIVLNIVKFLSLVVLTLYVFWNTQMTETLGSLPLWMATIFMVIPRKLLNMMATEPEGGIE